MRSQLQLKGRIEQGTFFFFFLNKMPATVCGRNYRVGKVSKLLFCNMIIIIDLGKSHHWRLKPFFKEVVGKQDIHTVLKSTCINITYFKL